MGGPWSGDLHLVMRQTFNSLSEEHPDLCSQQNISKSHSNRLYRDNYGISQKCKNGLSHRISALLFLALDSRNEREGHFKKHNSMSQKTPFVSVLVLLINTGRGRDSPTLLCFLHTQPTLPQDFYWMLFRQILFYYTRKGCNTCLSEDEVHP